MNKPVLNFLSTYCLPSVSGTHDPLSLCRPNCCPAPSWEATHRYSYHSWLYHESSPVYMMDTGETHLHRNLTSLLHFFPKAWTLWEAWKMLMQGFHHFDKTAAVNSCQIRVVRLRGKCSVRLKPPGLCWSFTVRRFIMLRALFTLIALQFIKASHGIRGGSPMPCQCEAFSCVPDTTNHTGFLLFNS